LPVRDDGGCVGCPCRGAETHGRGGHWSFVGRYNRIFAASAATEFSRGFEPTDRGATQSSPSRQRRMNAVRRGFVRVESTQGVFPVAIPFTSQGLYSTVADATENDWWATVIRGFKPTAKFSCRYAAEMRCSPRPTAHVHGFPSYGVGIPKSTPLCAGNHDTAGLRSSCVASATVEFSPAFQRRGTGFNPRITAPPMPPSRQRRLNLARRFNAGVWVSTHGSRLPTHPHAGRTPALPASSRSDG